VWFRVVICVAKRGALLYILRSLPDCVLLMYPLIIPSAHSGSCNMALYIRVSTFAFRPNFGSALGRAIPPLLWRSPLLLTVTSTLSTLLGPRG
jgi:hypothetical protein